MSCDQHQANKIKWEYRPESTDGKVHGQTCDDHHEPDVKTIFYQPVVELHIRKLKGCKDTGRGYNISLFGVIHFNPVAIRVFKINLLHAINPGCNGLWFAWPVFERNTGLVQPAHERID